MSEEQAIVRVRGPRRTAETIQHLVREFHRSQLSQAEFCRRHAVPLSTFQWYLKKYRDQSEAEVSGEVCAGLVAVEVAGSQPQEAENPLAVVLPKGRKIEVGIGFDAATLAQLVIVLEKI